MSVSVLWPTVSDLVGVEVSLHGLAAMLHVSHLVDVEAMVSRGESGDVSKEPHRGGWAARLVEVNHAGDLVRVDYSHSVVLQISFKFPRGRGGGVFCCSFWKILYFWSKGGVGKGGRGRRSVKCWMVGGVGFMVGGGLVVLLRLWLLRILR